MEAAFDTIVVLFLFVNHSKGLLGKAAARFRRFQKIEKHVHVLANKKKNNII